MRVHIRNTDVADDFIIEDVARHREARVLKGASQNIIDGNYNKTSR